MDQDGTVATVIALLALLLAAGCVAGALLLRRENERLAGRVAALHEHLDLLRAPADLPAASAGEQLITIAILNPLELAATQTRAATVLHRVRPQLLSRIVHEQAAREIQERLGEEGVVAEVHVHGGR